MASVYGIHLANGPQDIGRVVSLGCDHYLALEMQADYLVQCPGEWYLRLWEFAHSGAAAIADHVLLWSDMFRDIIPWNEANLESAHLGYGGIARRYLEVLERVGDRCTLHWPALSPCQMYRERVAEWRDAAMAAPVVDVHCYGTCDEMLEIVDWYRRALPDKPLLVTEFNFGAGRRVDPAWWASEAVRFYEALYNRPEVIAACGFIWRWYHPDVELQTTVDWEGQPVESAVRAATKRDKGGGYAVKLSEQFPELYRQWEAAGGVENNFRSHLLALGAIPATKADLLLLVDEAKAKLEQVRLVAQKLPFA